MPKKKKDQRTGREERKKKMLDDDFNQQMAALSENQRGANDRYARDIAPMSEDLNAMRARFEREMRGPREVADPKTPSQNGAAASDAPPAGEGMLRQMDKGKAVKETKRRRTDVRSGARVV